jgi:hypothetical protein
VRLTRQSAGAGCACGGSSGMGDGGQMAPSESIEAATRPSCTELLVTNPSRVRRQHPQPPLSVPSRRGRDNKSINKEKTIVENNMIKKQYKQSITMISNNTLQ